MSKNKTNTKWEYVTNPFDVYAFATAIRRAHAPLDPSLSINSGGQAFLHLRPCVQGVDQDGAVIKYLYCTRDGRFFVRKNDGWGEILPIRSINAPKNKKRGGNGDCVYMNDFGVKSAHRCVAFAWLDVPRDVKLQMIGVDAPTKWEVDHLNTDHRNWSADNLQWVTAEENRRRGKIVRKLRAIGIDPKRVDPRLLKKIYQIPDDYIGTLTGMYLWLCETEFGEQPLDVPSIKVCLAAALDYCYERMHVKP